MRVRRTLLTLGVLAILVGGLAPASSAQPGRSGDHAPRYYLGFAVPLADVAAAFHSDDFTRVPAVGLPLNVLLVCRWTWMCVLPPVGPNIHPNAEGYAVIAEAFLAALP